MGGGHWCEVVELTPSVRALIWRDGFVRGVGDVVCRRTLVGNRMTLFQNGRGDGKGRTLSSRCRINCALSMLAGASALWRCKVERSVAERIKAD